MTGFSITCLRCGASMVLKPGVSDPDKEPIRFGNLSEVYNFMKCKSCGNEIRDRFDYVFDEEKKDEVQVYIWEDASEDLPEESTSYEICPSGNCEI